MEIPRKVIEVTRDRRTEAIIFQFLDKSERTPIACVLCFESGGEEVRRKVSGEDGRFVWDPASAGSFERIVIRAPGYIDQNLSRSEIVDIKFGYVRIYLTKIRDYAMDCFFSLSVFLVPFSRFGHITPLELGNKIARHDIRMIEASKHSAEIHEYFENIRILFEKLLFSTDIPENSEALLLESQLKRLHRDLE